MDRDRDRCGDRWWCDDRGRGVDKGTIAVVVIIFVALPALIVPTAYGGWYDSTNTGIVDSGKAVRMDSDYWGRWVTLDTGNRWHVDDDAWTTIRVNDTVTVYDTWIRWETLNPHRISIS
jgi:hypothetical protein